MKFKGYGSIYNPSTKKILVDFQKTPEFETNKQSEIELIRKSGYVTEESGTMEIKEEIIITSEPEEKELTKKQVMESLDASGIDYNPRDKKEILLALLEE